jgi:uncharacterized repeat protein (TIGR02543 family)
MLKKLTAVLLVLCILLIQLPPLQVDALVVTNELKISSELTQWVLDEPTNTLYGVSAVDKALFFINAETLNLEKSLTFASSPTDIIKDSGNLYVALPGTNQIVIVNMASRTITGTLYTSSDPYRIVKDGDKIYYTEGDQGCNIYEYNLTTNTDHKIYGSVYQPDIAINPKDHILYIGESGSTGSNMTYYSTIDNKVIGKTNHNNGNGFKFPSRDVIFDGTNVYYAGRDFKLEDPTRFNGDFDTTENIIYVNKDLVFTNKSIHNKDTHTRLGYYGINVNLVEASDNVLYIYSMDKGTITRLNDSGKLINSSDVISLIPGSRATTLQSTQQSIKINAGISNLQMKSKLTQWVMDEPSNTLYGISKDDKALFFINAETLNLEKSLTFKSEPTDIIMDSGNLYVALDDANQIAIVNMASRTITGTLYTSSDPYRIEKDGDKIYYTERDGWCDIYEYNLITNADKKVLSMIYQPDIAINPKDHILYIGESGLSSSDLTYYSTIENKVIGKTGEIGFLYPGRYTIFDGEKVYYAGYDFDKQNLNHSGGYSKKEDILFAKYDCFLTKTYIYDSETYSAFAYGGNINLYEISDEKVTYYYSEKDNAILRVNTNKISVVQYNSQGGSKVEDILAYNTILIKAPTAPTKAGYTFGGWYKEATCVNAWNAATDKVTSKTTLYAKWIIDKPSIPTLGKAVSSSYNSINVSWAAVTGASGYEIYRATSSTGTYSLVTTTAATSYNNTALAAGNTYYYKVRAYRLVGTTKVYGNFTTVLSAKPVPSVPVNFTAVSSSSTSIKLTWSGVTGASRYEIYRSKYSTGSYSLVTTGAATSYNNTSLVAGTTYYYKVRAYRLIGTTKVYGNFTKVLSVKPVPSVPVNFTAVRSSSTSIKLTWSGVTGASGYEVYRATSSTGTYSLVKSTTTLYITNTSLKTGTTYYYKVRCYRNVGTTKVYSGWTVVKYSRP